MRSIYIGSYIVPDGYFGKTAIAYVCLIDAKLVNVYPHGWHTSAYLPMDFQNEHEARWYIVNHPNGRDYYRPIPAPIIHRVS